MKTIWKGTISFGLVSIPINLYSAIKSESLGFKLLHNKCHTPIKYLRWCPNCEMEVAWEHIVKGMPLEDGSYFILTQEKLEELKPEKSDIIEITEFIPNQTLAPIYIDNHYYLLPTKETDKAFFLFFTALQEVAHIAIGRFVLREKEHVCAIQPYKRGLLLSTLNYSYEIRDLRKLEELQQPKITQNELKLAKELIKQLTKKKFDIDRYKDTFAEKLKKRIKEAKAGKEKIKPKKVKPKKVKAPTLIDALKDSLKLEAEEVKREARK